MSHFNTTVETRFGTMIVNKNDMYIGRSLIEYGEFSYGEIDLFRQIVTSGSIVVEAGANIGAHTLFLAQQTGPTGQVYAIEPQRLAFQALCGTMALNGITNAVCLWACAGDQLREALIPVLDPNVINNFGGLNIESATIGDRVPVLTVDSLQLPSCRLIKADVEGMEESVLRGAVATIRRFRPALYLEADRDDRRASLFRLVDELGYQMYWHRPWLYNPDNYRGSKMNIFENIASWNVLALHKDVKQHIVGLEPITPIG